MGTRRRQLYAGTKTIDHRKKKNLKHHFLSPLLFPFLRNLGKTFYHFFLPLSPFTHILPKNNAAPRSSFVGFAGAADFDVKHPRRNGSCSSQGCMSGCYGQRSLRGTWPWDHPPVVGSNDMPIKRFLYQTQPWGNQRSHGETPPGQLVEANVISESVFLMFLVSFGGSKSKIEQNNTQLWIIC